MFPCLGSEHAFCLITVSFTFAVFLVGVLDCDFFVHEELAVHVGYCVVGCFEGGEAYEAVALG